MPNCTICNSDLPSDHPAVTLENLLVWIDANGGWVWALDDLNVGSRLLNGAVEIAALKKTYDSGDINVEAYYGESALPQGETFETYVIFKIGEIFYKMSGKGDSYGEVQWNGTVRQVEAKPKTVWTFE
jgi:hypothetical protein